MNGEGPKSRSKREMAKKKRRKLFLALISKLIYIHTRMPLLEKPSFARIWTLVCLPTTVPVTHKGSKEIETANMKEKKAGYLGQDDAPQILELSQALSDHIQALSGLFQALSDLTVAWCDNERNDDERDERDEFSSGFNYFFGDF